MAVAVNNRFSFGEFEVDAERRLLRRQGEVVPLTAKTFDLLVALVENAGEIVTKDQLLDRVWENQFVEENNLTVHIAALRKALGERRDEHRFIVTVPGKGYRFVSSVTFPSHGDVVVERRTLERIIVDQYEETDDRSPLLGLLKKRRSLVATGVVGVLFISAGLWFAYSFWAASGRSNTQPEVRTFATSGIPHRVAISSDGKLLAYVRRAKGLDSIWIGDVETKSNIQITPESNRLHTSIAFSPDSRTIFSRPATKTILTLH